MRLLTSILSSIEEERKGRSQHMMLRIGAASRNIQIPTSKLQSAINHQPPTTNHQPSAISG
jgi:hypothetical protein